MLNERQNNILKIIVEFFIKQIVPISSNQLVEKLNLSSATIRNEMMALEKLGFLEKTHTSSGRIPSEKGYRYYVDFLMKVEELSGEEVLNLQLVFTNSALTLNDTIKESMRLVTEITNCASIVLGSKSTSHNVKKVNFTLLNDNEIVLIIITHLGHIENQLIKLNSGLNVEEMEKVMFLINEVLENTPLSDVAHKIEFEIKPLLSAYLIEFDSIVQAFAKAFANIQNENNIFYSKATNLFNQPEFKDNRKMKKVIELIENKDLPKILIDSKDVSIQIGNETNISDDFSIITTPFKSMDGDGRLAIIGPKRMEYTKVIAMLRYIADQINK